MQFKEHLFLATYMIIQKQYMPQNYRKEIKNAVQNDREGKKWLVKAFPLEE